MSGFLASVFLPSAGVFDTGALLSAFAFFGRAGATRSSDSVVPGSRAAAARAAAAAAGVGAGRLVGCGARGRAAVRRLATPGRSSAMAVVWLGGVEKVEGGAPTTRVA